MRLEVTRRSDLAICALAELSEAGERLKTADLADRLEAAPAFMGQVLTELVRHGWVDSSPGPTGGYRLLVDLDRLAVADVVEALEGPTENDRCVVAEFRCGVGRYCALHQAWTEARSVLLARLRSTTVGDVAAPTSPPSGTSVRLASSRGIRARGDG